MHCQQQERLFLCYMGILFQWYVPHNNHKNKTIRWCPHEGNTWINDESWWWDLQIAMLSLQHWYILLSCIILMYMSPLQWWHIVIRCIILHYSFYNWCWIIFCSVLQDCMCFRSRYSSFAMIHPESWSSLRLRWLKVIFSLYLCNFYCFESSVTGIIKVGISLCLALRSVRANQIARATCCFPSHVIVIRLLSQWRRENNQIHGK